MREITLTVRGDTVHASRHRAGIQGEANATALVVTFDESWDGYAKKITFWDALEQNPVVRLLSADLLVDATTRTYKTTIPGEPLAMAGECLLVIDGYVEGARARSMSVRMTVEEAPVADNAGEPADPMPELYEQMQVEIESVMAAVNSAVSTAEGAASAAVGSAKAAQDAESGSRDAANEAKDYANKAADAAQDAVNRAAEQMTVSAQTLEAGEQATVRKTNEDDGAVHLHYGIPRGERGVSGVYVGAGDMPEGFNVQIDPEGSSALVTDEAIKFYVDESISKQAQAQGEINTQLQEHLDQVAESVEAIGKQNAINEELQNKLTYAYDWAVYAADNIKRTADYVVEWGTIEQGTHITWRKWNSGIAEMWFRRIHRGVLPEMTSLPAVAAVLGVSAYGVDFGGTTLPFAFVDFPRVTTNLSTNVSGTVLLAASGGLVSYQNAPGVRIIAVEAFDDNAKFFVDYYLVGRYRDTPVYED